MYYTWERSSFPVVQFVTPSKGQLCFQSFFPLIVATVFIRQWCRSDWLALRVCIWAGYNPESSCWADCYYIILFLRPIKRAWLALTGLFAWGCSSVPCSNDFVFSLMPIYESKFHFTLVNPELLYMNQYKDSVAYFGTNQDLIHWLCCSDGVHDWTDG